MDSLTQRGSVFDHVIEILLLTPLLAYAATELLVCLLWNLGFRTLQKLCSLVFQSFNDNCKHGTLKRQPPLRDGTIQNHAIKAVEFHQPIPETNKSIQRNAELKTGTESRLDTEFAWSSKNMEFTARENLKTKDERIKAQITKSRTSMDERTPRRKPKMFTTKWVTPNKAFRVERDTANKKDGLLVCCNQSDFEGKHEKKAVFCRGKMLLLHSDDQKYPFGEEESEDGLKQEIFDWKLRKRRSVSKQDFETPVGKSAEVEESAHLRLKAALCGSVKKDVIGSKETYKPLPDWSKVTEEKCYSSTLVFSGNSTDMPIVSTAIPVIATDTPVNATDLPVIATDTPMTASQVRKHFPVSVTFDDKTSEAEDGTSQTKLYCSFSSTASSIATDVIETPVYQAVEAQNKRLTAAQEQPDHMLLQRATTTTTEVAQSNVSERPENSFKTLKPAGSKEEERTCIYSNQCHSRPEDESFLKKDETPAELHTSDNSLVVNQKPKGEGPRVFYYSGHPWGTRKTNQKRTKAGDFSKLRRQTAGKIPHSRLPFVRAPRRTDLRKNRIPPL